MTRLLTILLSISIISQVSFGQEKKIKLSNLIIKNSGSYFPIGLEMEVNDEEEPYLLQFSINFPEVVNQITFSLGSSKAKPEDILTGYGEINIDKGKFLVQVIDAKYNLEELPSPYEDSTPIYMVTIPVKLSLEQVKSWKYTRIYIIDNKGKTKIIFKEIN